MLTATYLLSNVPLWSVRIYVFPEEYECNAVANKEQRFYSIWTKWRLFHAASLPMRSNLSARCCASRGMKLYREHVPPHTLSKAIRRKQDSEWWTAEGGGYCRVAGGGGITWVLWYTTLEGGAHHSDKLFEKVTITSSRRMKIINVLVEKQIITKIRFQIIKTNF